MKALIVERKREIASLLDDTGCAFTFTEAGDVAQIENMIEADGYQLIILSSSMSGVGCLSLISNIRRRSSSSVYIIVVGCPGHEVEMEVFRNAGADEVICDPVSGFELQKSIHTASRFLTLHTRLNQVRARVAELEKANVIGRLVPGITHELNNPLGFVTSNLSVLTDYCHQLREFVQNNCRDDLKEATSAAEQDNPSIGIDDVLSDIFPLLDECGEGLGRMKSLVGDLQRVTQQNDQPVDIDINSCLDTTLRVLWNEIRYKTVVHKSYGELSPVFGNSGQLHQVFLHLLLEATLVIGEQGEIDITTSNGNGYVTINIASSGYSDDDRQVTGEGACCANPGGSSDRFAAGLLFAHSIIRGHEGFLEEKTSGGAGTVFQVRLPVKHT